MGNPRQVLFFPKIGNTLKTAGHHIRIKSSGGKWVLTRKKVVDRLGDGRALRALGTISDIMGQKRDQEDIQILAVCTPLAYPMSCAIVLPLVVRGDSYKLNPLSRS